MKNEKGFTLVELLAVIVVLGIILLIAVPKIVTTINDSKLSSFTASAKLIAAEAEREYSSRTLLSTLNQDSDPITCDDVTNISLDYANCDITFDGNGVAYVSVYGTDKFDNMYCLNTTKETSRCNGEVPVYEESILNGAYPRISNGMIPVTIANNGTVTTVNPKSNTWYSYTSKKWANVVLVKETGTQTRKYYESNYGVTIPEEDILAYLVWIPRYRYTLWNVAGLAATYSGETCTANCPQTISVTFEGASTSKSTGSTNGTSLTHPAFTYNGVELNGIWVGKFETTQGTALNVGTTNPTIKPNITPWRNQNVSDQFNTSLLFSYNTIYNLSAESRMSKNSDWGAISYLSYSQYGINDEIRVNNYTYYMTGCGALTPDKINSLVCENIYGTVSTYPQSTTGTISGIFDISGGAYEVQMGSYTNITNDKYSGTCDYSNSGYNGKYGNPSQWGSCNSSLLAKTDGINYPNAKYYKLYSTTSWQSNLNYLGDALGETRGWYRDTVSYLNSLGIWFTRGGWYGGSMTSGAFNISTTSGGYDESYSFRTTVTTS